jgi:hypothetical protein
MRAKGDDIDIDILLFLQLVPQLKDLDLDLALSVVLQNALVRLALLVSHVLEVLRIGRAHVSRLQECEVTLDIA